LIQTLPTDLSYGSNCEQAFRFREKHLGGNIAMMMTHGQQPNAKDGPPDQKSSRVAQIQQSVNSMQPA
jgi:uncharacterized glyoxalase superfamily protein PhnB